MARLFKWDPVAAGASVLLVAISLITLYSVSFGSAAPDFSNFKKQLVSAVIGFALMAVFSVYDYRALNMHSTKLYFLMLAILLLVISFGTTVRGTTGWIGFGTFRIQPVEIAKVVMIIFLASFLSRKKTQLSIVVRIIASVVLVLVPVFLILKQPDFGSAMIIVGTWAIMLSVSGINAKNLLALALIGLAVAGSSWFFLKPYQKERIANFIDPYSDPRGSGYNVIQSMVAVGSGGIFGKGLGHGSQSQLNFLPERHTDFIFAVIAEEMGLFGAGLVFVLFGTLIYRMKEIARLANDNFGYLIVIGIIAMVFLQMLVNIGMNIGIAPVAGVPLPLLSYGGSSLVMTLLSIGIVQSVHSHRIKTLD